MAALRDAGVARALGIAPGPANGFTLDVIDCFERFGALIDWAMLILSPMEPWPGELALDAARRHGVRVITRVVDYGGLFWDDVEPGHEFAPRDHRLFRPQGWLEAGRAKLDRMRPLAARHGLTPLQLACAWNLAAVPAVSPLSDEEVAELRAIGDNTGSMLLKGATPDHDGPAQPDRWGVDERLAQLAERWSIDPRRDLARTA
jgi:aryl-alcohol dehydrogenase-like predicted oxidoreductase